MVQLPFDLFWRDHGVSKGLQGLGKDASTSQKHVETLGDHGSKLVGAFAGFAAIEVFKGFIEGAVETNRLSRITQNVIQSTGGAAHVTADQVTELTKSMSEKNGVDDDVIRTGANMLLTFTGIRNEVGKGNDIFNQASQATVDLAAAMNNGQVTSDGMKTASIQLGKALQDPVKGMTALRKVGVSFTDEQKAQIKAMVESGNVMGAQKVILGELNREFGGTAAAAADPMQRLSVIMEDLGKEVGQALLPAVTKFADFMTNTGAPAISTFVGVLADIPAPAYAVMAGLIGITGAVKAGHVVLESYRQVSEAVGATMKILGLRVGEAAAAEVGEAAAAKGAAASTAAAGDAAAVAGIKFGTLASRFGAVGIALAAIPVANWLSDTAVATVHTDELSTAVAGLGTAGDVGFRKLFNRAGWGNFKIDAQSSSEALNQFRDAAAIAFGSNWTDQTMRMASFGVASREAEGKIRDLDGALASLVQQGKLGNAQDAFAILAARMRQAGVAEDDIRKAFPQYYAAAQQAIDATVALGTSQARTAGQGRDEGVTLHLVAAAHRAAAGAATAHGSTLKALLDAYPKYKDTVLAAAGATSTDKAETVQLTAAQVAAVKASVRQKVALDALTGALDANKNATLQLRGGETAWYTALADVTAAVKQNGHTLDVHTAKGRANRQALDQLASAGLSYLGVIEQNEGVGRHFKKTLDVQWQALYAAALRFGATKAEAHKYADEIYKVPKTLALRVSTPGLSAARAGARGLASDIAHINGRVITVKYRSDGSVVINGHVARAAGGAIPGWSPSKTADNVPVMATAGEHMWSVDEVRGAGGHAGVERLRAAARVGALRLAAGGAVNRNLVTRYEGHFPQGVMTDYIDRWAATQATSGAGGGGGGGPIPGGSGVARWGPMVHRALSVVGLAQSLWDNWMRQIATESGGNPNAVQGNIGDINNRTGDLAKGLLQVIGATYRAYHWPGTAWNVFDPWSNMTTAMNYGKHRYSNLEAVIGHGHGYARGTRSASPGWHLVGENGPELVRFRGGEQVLTSVQTARGGGGPTYQITINAPNYLGSTDNFVRELGTLARQGRLDSIIRRAS